MHEKKILYIILFIFLLPFTCLAEDRSAPEWMNYSIGARATALGQAFAAFADDSTAAFNNPAGLPNIFSASDTGNKLWLSATYSYLPFERHLGAFTTSFKAGRFILGISGLFTKGKNQIAPDRGSTDNESDTAWLGQFTIATSLPDNQNISFGSSLKIFQDTTDGIKGTGFAGDIGMYVAIVNMISLGAFVKNIGFIKYENMETRFVAPTVSFGIGYNPLSRRNFAFCLHLERNTGKNDNPFIASGGLFFAVYSNEYMSGKSNNNPIDETAEARPKKVIYYNSIYINLGFHGYEFSIGTTFNFFGFKLDYAFVIETTEKNQYSHVVTFEGRF